MTEHENFSTTYEEREEKTIDELRDETVEALTIAFSNLEYILGNAKFVGTGSSTYSKLESMRAATQEMITVLRSDAVGEWVGRQK